VAEALAHCGECHTPRNLAFALDNRRKFTGEVTAGWRAFNITADKGSGVGGWSDEDPARLSGDRARVGPRHGGGADGRGRRPRLEQHVAAGYPRAGQVSAQHSGDRVARFAREARAAGTAFSQAGRRDGRRQRQEIFEGACVSCHDWTGVSAISPFATIAGTRAVNDRTATNVAQIVISGTMRSTPPGVLSMPAFGRTHSRVILENVLCIAIRDRSPVTTLHTLIIPKRHVSAFLDLYQPELNAAQALVKQASSDIRAADPTVSGFNIGMNVGKDAGQTVFHAHIHLIPRRHGDIDDPRGGVRGVIPSKRIY
jgi:diadenosine tetraphosphate (Ap4A) HIT family hydrolase